MKIPKIGCMIWHGSINVGADRSHSYGRRLTDFDWNWKNPEEEKIVVFSDANISQAISNRFSNVKYKVAWLMENPEFYTSHAPFTDSLIFLKQNLSLFEVVATHDDSLIEKYPDKFKYVPFGGIRISRDKVRIYPKIKKCVMVAGCLHFARPQIWNKYKDSKMIDFLGLAFHKSFVLPEEGYKDYMYSVVCSGSCANRYFSDNLLDPMACGTIPIWKGCSKIGDFFNMKGIITFNTIEEFDEIMKKINLDDYSSRLEAINDNLKLIENYREPENSLWKYVLADLYEKININI